MLQISTQPGLRRHQHALEPALVGALRAPFYQLGSGAAAAVRGRCDEDLEVFLMEIMLVSRRAVEMEI